MAIIFSSIFFLTLLVLEVKNAPKGERKQVLGTVLGLMFFTVIFFVTFVAFNGY